MGVHPGGGFLRPTGAGDGEWGGEGAKTEHAGKKVPRGSRQTPERLREMKIGEGFLSDAERQLFVDILYEFDGALAFDDSEMGLLDERIEPPVTVHTVPHTPIQQNNLLLPKAMQEEAAKIMREKTRLWITGVLARTVPRTPFSCRKEGRWETEAHQRRATHE